MRSSAVRALLVSAAIACVAVGAATAPAQAAVPVPNLGLLQRIQPGLLSGVRLSPSPVRVGPDGIPVGTSLSFRLSKQASIAFTIYDLSGRAVANSSGDYNGGELILGPGPGSLPLTAPGSATGPNLPFYGALRPGKRYVLLVSAGYSSRFDDTAYLGIPQIKLFSTTAA